MMPLRSWDPDDRLHRRMAAGTYESREVELLRKHLRPGGAFVDVGAHIGYFTTLGADLVGPKGAVFAFEPCRESFKYLAENVAGIPQVCISRIALGREDGGHLQLRLSKDNSGDHRMFDSGDGRAVVAVACGRLDARYVIGRAIDLLKVDVQGYEMDVLEGAERLLAFRKVKRMVVEFYPPGLRLAGHQPPSLPLWIAKRGFRIWRVGGAELADAGDVMGVMRTLGTSGHTNLYCELKP